ncbi:MAG TPA: uroporphyrinogen-III synthase [Ignavibacteriaceae bacterium]|nr:uroporphyrinogen-III synthase [Ignavibacteriaceae bacterium]
MIVKEEKIKRKEKKRERMLEVAAELFSKKNYHEVMMDDVARLTDVAKGTVYNYFTSKEELYFTIMSSKLGNLNTSLKNKIASEISVIDSLHTYIIHLYMFMMKYQNFFLMYQKEYMNAQNEFCDELRAMSDELKSILSDVIYKGKRENQFRDIDESFAVKLVLGSVFGAVQRGIENKYTGEKLIEEREKLFDFVLHGLYSGFNNNKVRPLKNKTIVLTRAIEQSKESAAIFSELGAEVIVFPTLEIVPPNNWDKFDELILSSQKIDFIVFTSVHAVTMFIKRCNELNKQFDFKKTKVVAVGNKTKSVCEENEIKVDIVPKKFSGEGVVEELSKSDLKDKLVFIPRSAIGREDLPKGLEELGAKIITAPVYNVSLPSKESVQKNIEQLNSKKPDVFIFTSPSTFENFLLIMNINNPVSYFKNYDVAAIGPTTKSAIENSKVKVSIMPDEFTIKGLANKMIEFYNHTEK